MCMAELCIDLQASHYYYMTKLVVPRMSTPWEVQTDYMVEVRCHLHDALTMTPEVNTIRHVQE